MRAGENTGEIAGPHFIDSVFSPGDLGRKFMVDADLDVPPSEALYSTAWSWQIRLLPFRPVIW